MSELRKDPIGGRWVVFSSGHNKGPGDFPSTLKERSGEPYDRSCPFCRGNEHYTDHEIFRIPDPAGWLVRCVPNHFPALAVENVLQKKGDGIYDCMAGVGAHEIIIDTPNHSQVMAALSHHHFQQVLNTYRQRILDLSRDLRLQYALIFKNHGRNAGQMLPHSHSQLIALPFIPRRVQSEIDATARYLQFKDRYLFDDIMQQELTDGSRVFDQTANFVALCPYAPRFPFEVWILPKVHNPRFETLDDAGTAELAGLFRATLQRINRALNFPAYNLMLHNAPMHLPPRMDEWVASYHWHFELIPKITRMAGFELGSGCYINPTLPEQAAAFLRGIDPEE